MDDWYEMDFAPTYGEMLSHVKLIEKEVANLDQDSLVDEISGMQHNIVGKESKRIQALIFKAHADEDLEDHELSFLRNVYLVYHCAYAVVVDEPEDDLEV